MKRNELYELPSGLVVKVTRITADVVHSVDHNGIRASLPRDWADVELMYWGHADSVQCDRCGHSQKWDELGEIGFGRYQCLTHASCALRRSKAHRDRLNALDAAVTTIVL